MLPSKDFAGLYQSLVENMSEAVWVGDENERTVYANPRFCELIGYSLTEMIGRESYDFWDEESARTVRETNQKNRKKGINSSYTGNLLTKKGKLIPVLLNGAALPNGGTVGIMTDLRKLKEKELAQKMLSQAVEQANDMIVILDHKKQIVTWNKGAKNITGHKKSAIVGANFSDFFQEDFSQLLEEKTYHRVELTGLHQNGSNIKISAIITTLHLENSADPYYLFIGHDITHQSRFEEELAVKYQRIKEVYETLGVVRRYNDYIFDLIDFANQHQGDPKIIGEFVVSSVMMLSKVDACCLQQLDGAQKNLELLAGVGLGEEWLSRSRIPYEGSLCQKAMIKGFPLKIVDITANQYQEAYLARKENLCSALVIPLKKDGKAQGALILYASADKKLTIFENDFIEKYAKVIELVLY